MKTVFLTAGATLVLLLTSSARAAVIPPASALVPPAAPAAPAPLSAEQAELLLQRDMALVARCDVAKTALFLGRYYGEALDSMIAVENGAALRYPVHGGRFERIGEKLSARFEVPESFRLSVDGNSGRLLYANDAKKNAKAFCRFYQAL
jgi:hypothetical protein